MGDEHNYDDWAVKIGGKTLKAAEHGMMVSAIVVDLEMDKIESCTIELADGSDEDVLEGEPYKIGDSIQIDLGDSEGGTDTVFIGEVVALEPRWPEGAPCSLVIRGLDRLHRLKRGTGVRYWEDSKDSDVVEEIAGECGLSTDCDTTSVTHKYILQNNVGNGEFIKALARRNGYQVSIDDSTLRFWKPPAAVSGAIELSYETELMDCRMRLNAIGQVSEVIVRGWDFVAKKEITGKGTSGDLSANGPGTLGADLAKDAFGDATAYVTNFPVPDQGAANDLAKALIAGRAGQFLSGSGRAAGDPSLIPGMAVDLKLLGDFSGKYVIHAARHVIGPKGYVVDFEFSANSGKA
jgi:uncharacterized protein